MSQPANQPPNTNSPSAGPRVKTCIEDIGGGQLCGGKHLARGLCSKHYLRRYRIDDRPPLEPKGPPLTYLKVSLTKEQIVKLKRIAKKRSVKATEVVRWAVSVWLNTPEVRAELNEPAPAAQVSSMT